MPVWDILPENKFQLVFDEKIDGPLLANFFSQKDSKFIGEIGEEEEISSSESEAEAKEIIIE